MKATESDDLRADSIEKGEQESEGENVREREKEQESATHPFTQGCTRLTE